MMMYFTKQWCLSSTRYHRRHRCISIRNTKLKTGLPFVAMLLDINGLANAAAVRAVKAIITSVCTFMVESQARKPMNGNLRSKSLERALFSSSRKKRYFVPP